MIPLAEEKKDSYKGISLDKHEKVLFTPVRKPVEKPKGMSTFDIMTKLNRHDRRRLGKLNKIKIPGIDMARMEREKKAKAKK